MATVCTVCTHPDRAEIEAQLVRGSQSTRAIAREHGLGRDSLSRHIRRHIPALERELYAMVEGASATSLAEEIVDNLQFMRDLRDDADKVGDFKIALAAAKALITGRVILANRLGIDSSEAMRELADVDAFMTATVSISKNNPAFAETLATELEAQGNSSLAATVQGHAQRQRAALAALPHGEARP